MKRILIISLAFLLFSCKITKQATMDTKTEITEQTEVKEQTIASKSDNSVSEISENENVIITVFSAPDSVGKQHITSITEIIRNKTVLDKKNIVLEKETVKNTENKTQKAENVKVTEKSQTKTKTHVWLYMVVVVMVVGILGVLRRYFF